jgi:hypothetical protein
MNPSARTRALFPAALAIVVAIVPGAAAATSTTCTTSVVCAEFINTYTYSSGANTGGVAIHGEADSGIGIRGTSVTNVGFYGASGSGSIFAPGLEGESTNTQSGGSTAGAFGLLSYFSPQNASADGFDAYGLHHGAEGSTYASGSSAIGSFGVAAFDSGGGSNGDYNAAVAGQSYYGTAMLAEASQTGPTAGIYGKSPVGVYAVSNSENGTPSGGSYAFVGESSSYGMSLYNSAANANVQMSTPNYAFLGTKANGNAGNPGAFDFDYSGNEYLSGTLTTSKGGPYVRTTGSSGAAVREYTTRSTVPNVEDVGEAQLANGRAYVPIEARFGDAIDRHASYLVFVTPEGDCHDLFVTQKTAVGFVVREMRGGRSTLPFQYRIVAKPLGENGGRLDAFPTDPIPKEVALDRSRKPEFIARPLRPAERMQKHLGPRGYAAALKALQARLTPTR